MKPVLDTARPFKAMNPIEGCEQFGRAEIARLAETEPEYDAAIYQEALAMILHRLQGEDAPQ